MTDPIPLRVASFNLRNIEDRYEERKPLLMEAFAAMDAEIAGLQEVTFAGHDQDDLLADAVPGRAYRSLRAESVRFRGNGTAILAGTGEVQVEEILRLSPERAIQRALFVLPGLHTLWFVNTHLHHKKEEPEVRTAQVQQLINWMAKAPAADATIVTGDFNMPPSEPGYALMTGAGFRSAFVEATGAEPEFTRPSGIIAPNMDRDGKRATFDYIWISGAIEVRSARLAATQPAAGDATLFPSDHFAVVAEVVVGESAER